MFDIFICYSRIELGFVHSLNLALKNSALDVWVAYEKIPNEPNWYSFVNQAIDRSKLCLIVVNQDLINSPSCFIEIETIMSLQKPTILIFRSNNFPIPKYLLSLNLVYSCTCCDSIEFKDMLTNIVFSVVEKTKSLSDSHNQI